VLVSRAARDEAVAELGRRSLRSVPGSRALIILVLLLIAFFSAISGKPLDGLLMLLVAAALSWDARPRHGPPAAVAGEPAAEPAEPVAEPAGAALAAASATQADRPALLRGSAWLLGGAVFAVLAGSFARFSWPATIAVLSVGTLVVLIGWQGPVRRQPVPGPLPRAGLLAWGALLAAGGLWELWSLFQQSSLTVTSYAHPTLSALTDPVLTAAPGRTLVLAGWLLLGAYLVRR
jgi:hypothetical protein